MFSLHEIIINAIKNKYNTVIEPARGDICYATTNRQTAVKDLTEKCDIIFVVGSENSSNSNRLKEISTRAGVPAYLLDCADDLDVKWLSNKKNIGLTAGASAPEISLPDTSGSIFNLSSLRGSYVLIDFWAAWCRPCRQENPNVVRLYNKYQNENFKIGYSGHEENFEASISAGFKNIHMIERHFSLDTNNKIHHIKACLLYTSPSPRDRG